MKNKNGVFVSYGKTKFKLHAEELQLMADALEIVNPDSTKMQLLARKLSASFSALAEYAKSLGD
jgi:hypothetical protein